MLTGKKVYIVVRVHRVVADNVDEAISFARYDHNAATELKRTAKFIEEEWRDDEEPKLDSVACDLDDDEDDEDTDEHGDEII